MQTVAAYDQQAYAWNPYNPSVAGPSGVQAPVLEADRAREDGPADFGQLRPYLDEAKLGEPTRKGIPRQSMLECVVEAAANHTIPFVNEIEPGKFPKAFADRPLASW